MPTSTSTTTENTVSQTITWDASEAVRHIKIVARFTGEPIAMFRLRIAALIIRFAAFVAGCGIEIEA